MATTSFQGSRVRRPQPAPRSSSRRGASVAPTRRPDFALRLVRGLIWSYLFLILFEGVLRKWLLPSLAQPLLLIRDPIVFAIYAIMATKGRFPRHPLVLGFAVLGALSLVVSFLIIPEAPIVSLFGFRCDFLHLPLIFIIGQVFGWEDVRRAGHIVLLTALPMALLMFLQFRAGPSSFLNAGAGEGAGQIASAGEHVRPAGVFSFITGPVYFFALVNVFVLSALMMRLKYSPMLVWLSFGAVGLAAGVAASRTLLVTVAIVIVTALIGGIFVFPRYSGRLMKAVAIMVIVGMMVSQLPAFKEGAVVTQQRISNAADSEGDAQHVVSGRVLKQFEKTFSLFDEVPIWGRGLGTGTVVGTYLSTGVAEFGQGSESDWPRNMWESGPMLGTSFIVLRIILVAFLIQKSYVHGRKGNLLPFIMVAPASTALLIGQLGQTTVVGFGVACAGLCLAAMRDSPYEMAARPRWSGGQLRS